MSVGSDQPVSENNGGYCRVRRRLPLSWPRSIFEFTRTPAKLSTRRRWRWHGHRVIVVDGTSARLPDTSDNQNEWPQPKTQKAGCGFPVIHILAAFNLDTACLEHYAIDKLYTSERAMFRAMRGCMNKGDVLLGDRGFCGFAEFHELMKLGVHSVMRKHSRLGVSLKTLRRISKTERIVTWYRTAVPSKGYTRDEWKALPKTMTVREIQVTVKQSGFRTKSYTLLTTLRDTRRYTTEDFATLYRRRWQVELRFDEIKTHMGMVELHCKSPEMVQRELLMFLIAYNLIRLTMLKAAEEQKASLER